MKKIIYTAFLLLPTFHTKAIEPIKDSLFLQEVIITAPKEGTVSKELPEASYSFGMRKIETRQINSIKDLSLFIPNFYIPNYGSKITSSVYVRGIGSRMNEASIGLYVDNVPYIDKTCFDFDFYDIQSVTMLQGPQGTLYGRNAIGGLLNIYTVSPLAYQGSRFDISYGNYDDFRLRLSHYRKLSSTLGLALAGYYNYNGGVYTNTFNGDKTNSKSAGGRMKLDWQKNKWKSGLSFSYDHTYQKAYPYAKYDTINHTANPIRYNDDGSYLRNMLSSGLNIQHTGERILFTSSTGYQYLDDRMNIDQDFTADSIFSLSQMQKQHTITQEFVLRSTPNTKYQWVSGLFGFYKSSNINSPMVFESGAIKMLQGILDGVRSTNPYMPNITITNHDMPIEGKFKMQNRGIAAYHQSSYNFNQKLSVTGGLRLDYEKVKIDYNTNALLKTLVTTKRGTMAYDSVYSVVGSKDKDFMQLLFKAALLYKISENNNVYSSISKGYKAGGYNYTMFSDVIESQMKGNPKSDVEKVISYKPETSFNYELGIHTELIKNKLHANASVFYIDNKNQQMSTSSSNGSRLITNADKVESYGLEISANTQILQNLWLNVAYGYTHSTFKEYKDTLNHINYKGKFVPFVPQNTLSLGVEYSLSMNRQMLDKIIFSAGYNALGRIYWVERNTLYQNFYGLLTGEVSFVRQSLRLTTWVKNALNQNYNVFYFESLKNSFIQKGLPVSFGVSLNYSI